MRFLPLLVLLLVACQPTTESSRMPDNPGTATPIPPVPTLAPEMIALGETIYVQECASCHGANLEGEPNWKEQNADGTFRAPPHDESGHTWHHGDPTLLEAIRLGGARLDGMNIGGSSEMPAFGDTLSDKEITAVLVYIKSTWPGNVRTMQWEATLREREKNR